MTATDELCRMLDERGVEYDVRDGKAIKNTYWDDAEGIYSYSTIDSAALYAADCDIKATDGTASFVEYVELLRETLDGFEKSILRALESSQSRAN